MTINPSGWRPASPSDVNGDAPATTTGNRALMLEEPLLFEIGNRDQTGVDFDDRPHPNPSPKGEGLNGLLRTSLDLPGLSEPETVRHYTTCRGRIMRSTWGCSRSDRAR